MDKDKIIKALECYCESDSFDKPNCKDCPAECMSGYMSIPFIQQVLAMLKEQEWIPVGERLPETEDEVLTTYIVNGNQKKRYVETASYFNECDGEGHWVSVWDEYRVGGTKIEVIAWMPLPKPYRQ